YAAFATDKVASPAVESPVTITPDHQSNDRQDLETTAKIRRALVNDGDLSVYAQNVVVVTRGGHVSLSGEVRSASERQQVIDAAKNVAGANKVSAKNLMISAE